MAIAEVFIPDGEFCGDHNTLGCRFESHMEGFHWCSLYKESSGNPPTKWEASDCYEPDTRAEVMRRMTDEELAHFLVYNLPENVCDWEDLMLKWLREFVD